MFVITNDGSNRLINLKDVASVLPFDTGEPVGSCVAMLYTGESVRLGHDIETIETMGCPVIRAEPGYVRLVHHFREAPGSYECQPVIAWRLRSPYPPEAITVQHDGTYDDAAATAIEEIGGAVVTMDGERLKSRMEWFLKVARLRADWEAAKANGATHVG